jgi:asparagine synthase (glutamine-hydrolysing)
MCGIAGILNFNPVDNVQLNQLKNITNPLNHRGPDDDGYYLNNNIGLGFKRLSIIDIKQGHQPLSNYNKKIWITFNGEIYNFKELRDDLIKKKHIFITNSDTEVIVNLYEEYGERCTSFLRGMFAFVIWDDEKKMLFGARDRLGIKPFYYYIDNEKMVWASEIKSILKANVKTKLNFEALDQYITYGHTLKDSSIHENISKLEPGTSFTIYPFKGSKVNFAKYWTLEYRPDYLKSSSDFEEEIRDLVNESIKMRMISDVPLGAFLSGGVDSSTVVASMSQQSDKPIKTFSIGFKEQKFNELKYANIVSKKYNTDHHELIVEPKSIDLLPDLVKSYDEPFADSSAIPTYYLSKFAREHVTVALSGDGGDELFAGYSSYNNMLKLHNRPFNNRLINSSISAFHKICPEHIDLKKWAYYFSVESKNIGAYLGIFKPYERNNLYNNDLKSQLNHYQSESVKIKLLKSFNGDFISKMQQLDMNTYLVDDILTKVDRASMSNSLEVRVPLLDHKLVELSARIPSNFKITNNGQKIIFKNAFKQMLPPEIFTHKKQGFTVPVSMWFRENLKDYVGDTLLSNNTKLSMYFNPKEIEKIVNNHNKGMRDYSAKIWSLLFLEEWMKNN